MPQRFEVPLASGEGVAKCPFIASRSLVNCYVEVANGRKALYAHPGLETFCTLDASPIRSDPYFFGSTWLVVAGQTLYSVTTAGVASSLGTIAGTGVCVLSSNTTQVLIVADTLSYIWNGSALSQISDGDFYTASSVDMLDLYFILTRANTAQFFISAISDGTAYDATEIQTAYAKQGNARRVLVDNRDVLIFKEKSVEGWYNSGNADFPFSRGQLMLETGLAGRDCVARIDNSVAWLDHEFKVRILRGGTAQIISTNEIADRIAQWSDPGSARAFSYALGNHAFWVLRHDDGCVIWDASAPAADAWSIRESYEDVTWRCGFLGARPGQIIAGDAVTGVLYTLTADAHDEAGDPLIREVRTNTIGPGGAPFTLDAVEIEVETGVGLVTGQGSDPEVWLYLSRDSGRSYGARLTRKIGARGDREKRIVFGGPYGQFPPHGGVLRFGLSDPVTFVPARAFVEVTVDA